MKQLLLSVFSVVILIGITARIAVAQPITLSEKKVIYELPFSGILPDNPLFFVKELRDTILEFMTRDYMKKADMLLVSSDKKASMAYALSAKGKTKLMIEILEKGESQSLRIPGIVKESRKQGVSPNEGFVYRLKLSNIKHREVMEDLIQNLPQGQEQDMNKALELNGEVKRELEAL